ncbi:MAG: hypothetical protein SFY67_19495 [Candidatus Melainabacteria bacterium]|nr:hypothetical protein [Candidatus Melainabacteria bacterium]
MFLRSTKALGLSLALTMTLIKPGLAQEPTEAPDAFLKRYFQTLHTAKSLEDLKPFYPNITAKDEENYKNAPPEMKKMVEELALGMCKQEPRTVKILSKQDKNGKVYFDLSPDEIPTEYKKHATDPRFSMKGSVALVSEGGQWKVYKDHWQVKTYDNGEMKVSFGRDPDKEDTEPQSQSQANPEGDYGDKLRSVFTKNWTAKGKGSVQTIFKVSNGAIVEITADTKGDKTQADFIKSLMENAKSVPVLPEAMAQKPYGWMQFDWKDDAYCVNGPFFGSEPQKINW